jgi:hypothetical protein
MPINPNIPLQAANIPQIRYQPESQFESFAKIQPTLNAMQQLEAQRTETAEKQQQREALQQMRQGLMAAGKSGDLGMYSQALIGSGDARLMEMGARIQQALMEEARSAQALKPYQGQPVTRESVQNMMLQGGVAGRTAGDLARTLPAEPKEQQDLINVGGALYQRSTGKFLQPPQQQAAGTQARRYISTPDGVFDTETQRYIPRPARAPEATPTGTPAAAPAMVGTPAQQAKVQAQNQAKEMLSQELGTVLGYYEELNRMGAMVSPERPSAANVAAAARATGPGQTAERFLGTRAQTLRDNIANARLRLFNHVKNATGASAQQMNSNLELQTWLNAMTNPGQSIETVRETLGQLDAVLGSVRNQMAAEASGQSRPQAAPAAPRTPAATPTQGSRREIAPGVFVTERP